LNLHTQTIGQGPELVLLHGWGMSSRVWSGLLPQLTERHRVTLIELPGHGASDYDPELGSLDDWVAACLAVAPDRADWIGWSLGGQIALQAALHAPLRITRLVLVCSSPRFVQTGGWSHAIARNTLRQFARTLGDNPQQTLTRFLSLQVQGDEAARETLRLLRQEVDQCPAPYPAALKQGLDLLLTNDLRDQCNQLSCPSLWLLGDQDSLVPGRVAGDLRQMAIPGAEIHLLAGCAHAPFLSHPAESLALLKGFLAGRSTCD